MGATRNTYEWRLTDLALWWGTSETRGLCAAKGRNLMVERTDVQAHHSEFQCFAQAEDTGHAVRVETGGESKGRAIRQCQRFCLGFKVKDRSYWPKGFFAYQTRVGLCACQNHGIAILRRQSAGFCDAGGGFCKGIGQVHVDLVNRGGVHHQPDGHIHLGPGPNAQRIHFCGQCAAKVSARAHRFNGS